MEMNIGQEKVILEPENTLLGEFQKERTNAITEMFHNADEFGLYPTTEFFVRLDNCVRKLLQEERERILKVSEGAMITHKGESFEYYLVPANELSKGELKWKQD